MKQYFSYFCISILGSYFLNNRTTDTFGNMQEGVSYSLTDEFRHETAQSNPKISHFGARHASKCAGATVLVLNRPVFICTCSSQIPKKHRCIWSLKHLPDLKDDRSVETAQNFTSTVILRFFLSDHAIYLIWGTHQLIVIYSKYKHASLDGVLSTCG